GAEVPLDRLESLVAGQSSPELDLEAPDGQVEFVVDDDDLGRVVDAEPLDQRRGGGAGLVVEGGRDGGDDAGSGRRQAQLGHLGPFTTRGRQYLSVTRRQHGDAVGSDVVARAG